LYKNRKETIKGEIIHKKYKTTDYTKQKKNTKQIIKRIWRNMMPRYGLDGLEIAFNVGEIFSARPERPRGPFNFQCNRCLILPGGKSVGGWR